MHKEKIIELTCDHCKKFNSTIQIYKKHVERCSNFKKRKTIDYFDNIKRIKSDKKIKEIEKKEKSIAYFFINIKIDCDELDYIAPYYNSDCLFKDYMEYNKKLFEERLMETMRNVNKYLFIMHCFCEGIKSITGNFVFLSFSVVFASFNFSTSLANEITACCIP